MVRCQVLDDGVELGGSQSLDRGSFRPNLEDVRWTVHLRSTAERGTDDPGRHVQPGVFGIHLPGVVLELARVAGLGVPQWSHGMSRLSMTSRAPGGLGGGGDARDSGIVLVIASSRRAKSRPRGLKTSPRFAVIGSAGSPTTSHETREWPSPVSWTRIRPNSPRVRWRKT